MVKYKVINGESVASMPRRTNPFQELTASIMATFYEPEYEVVESVLMKNKRTGVIREIDIRIINRQNSQKRILVECRDHKRKQNVQWIDELDGKARSLSFTKVIAVSSSGFSKPALDEASDRGIEALHLKTASHSGYHLQKMYELDILNKTPQNTYVLKPQFHTRSIKINVLTEYVLLAGKFWPKSVFFASYLVMSLLIGIVLIQMDMKDTLLVYLILSLIVSLFVVIVEVRRQVQSLPWETGSK